MLIVGDLHFDAPARYQVGGENVYLEDVTKSLIFVLESVAKDGEVVVFLGDIFEKKDRVQNKVKNRLLRVLRHFMKEKGLEYVFVVGNHDLSGDGEMTLEILRGYGRVVKRSKVIELDGYRVQVVPWDVGGVKCLIRDDVDLVLGHFRVDGARMGVVLDKGEGCYVVEEFKTLAFDGHYHVFQILGDKVVCVGSLVQVDWGDVGVEKVVCRFERGDYVFYVVEKFIDRKIVYVRNSEEELLREELKGKYVRVDVEMNKVDVAKVVKVLRDVGVRYYEVNLVRREQVDFDKFFDEFDCKRSKSFDVFEEIIRRSLDGISDENLREVYERVIREVLMYEDK